MQAAAAAAAAAQGSCVPCSAEMERQTRHIEACMRDLDGRYRHPFPLLPSCLFFLAAAAGALMPIMRSQRVAVRLESCDAATESTS